MRYFAIAQLTLMLIASPNLLAQETIAIEPGRIIRITVPALGISQQVGEFEALHDGTLVVSANSRLQYPLSTVSRLEVYRGRQSHPWRGAGIGFLTGYATGFLVWVAAAEGCYEGASTASCAAVLGGGVGAIAGTIIGAFVGGVLVKTDRWDEVPLDGVRLSLMPRPDGFGVGASFAF
ncbi:MAG: hypothetical protein P8X82_10715 [Gemmatimonadales bacterium]